VFVCIYVLYICYLTVSSPYLLVFDDDRAHYTPEQMTLQVDLVRPRAGVRLVWEKIYQSFYVLWF